ncbi:potassium channel family protein [Candidatus Magnetobacterium casense]|uniref:potassium channel family protein n=1 Tax=Candidatus Magnetobacterium casense TaxID=1455061 RepID=UPI0009DE27C1|nr:potassium channel protein [Candidatus Magnetobacterium casensis]
MFSTSDLRGRMILSLVLIVLILCLGTLGFVLIEGWSTFDAFYMVIITLATIGFQEVHPLSAHGRGFTIVLIFFGVGLLAYSVNVGLRVLLEGELQEVLGRRKLKKRIQEIKDHYIICGYGRMGRIICKELKANGIPFVVIDQSEEDERMKEEMLFINGDATLDEILNEAGIDRARGLVSVLSSDAQNLFVVLSARVLNPTIKIVARAAEDSSEKKLLRAGADRVIAPYHIGGLKIAHTILKPAVVDFLEFATMSGNIELQMEEVIVAEGSELADRVISDSGIGRNLRIIIVAIKRQGGKMTFNPTHNTFIMPGDTLIALGEVTRLKELKKMANP